MAVKSQVRTHLEAVLRDRQVAYYQTFGDKENRAIVAVLEDLARFCRANTSTFHPDPRAHALAEGRREVWLRIEDHLKLTIDELYEKYNKSPQTA